MHVLVGVLVTAFGVAIAVFGPTFSKAVGSRASGRFDQSNAVAFRAIGVMLALVGLLYVIGVVG
ncbi:hypothetical protein ACWERI_34710 [Streptomyces collinus]|uniref:hypothetical protein n=1 Tax=Streptomyces collinus TaxID=42684 RepID=UPI0011DDBECF|nr:hypothetical protein [Streptomyces collinus]